MEKSHNHNKELMNIEAVIIVVFIIMLFSMVMFAATFAPAYPVASILMIIIAVLSIFAVSFALTKMEQIVGYYVCDKCHHKYVPSYKAVLWSMHMGRTRYLTCPKCHKKSWQKKQY